jgi:hypothetical protein
MPVNPLKITRILNQVIGIKETLRHLSDGKPLGMFPAGVSSYKDGKLMVDKPWEEGAIKVIVKHKFLLYLFTFTLEIVGYFIFFQNQWDLRTAKLPSSFSQKRRVIKE